MCVYIYSYSYILYCTVIQHSVCIEFNLKLDHDHDILDYNAACHRTASNRYNG